MKALFIAGHEFLYNPQNGGQKCSLRNYRLLQQSLGEENVYLCMFSNHQYNNLTSNEMIYPTYKNNIEMFFNVLFLLNVCNKQTAKKVRKDICRLDIDFIFVDSSTIGYLIEKLDLKKPIICFFHNIEVNYAWNKYKHEGKKYIIAYLSYKYNEKCAAKIANRIILLNKRDQKEMERLYQRKADLFLPITFDDEFNPQKVRKQSHEKVELLFVGSFFKPNVEGLLWFINEVMTQLDKNKYILRIVGKNLETLKETITVDNIDVIGTVDDLSQYYYEADAVVIPIFYGDGMKVKTAEAMMFGKNIIATDEALEGYTTCEGIYRVNTVMEFIHAIENIKLETSMLNNEVRNNFLLYYETNKLSSKFKSMINEINL